MVKLEKLMKDLEEVWDGQGYELIYRQDHATSYIKADDGIFGRKFIRYICHLDVSFHLCCEDCTIVITNKDLLERY